MNKEQEAIQAMTDHEMESVKDVIDELAIDEEREERLEDYHDTSYASEMSEANRGIYDN